MNTRTLALGLIAILVGACAVTPRASTSIAYTPKFDFTPPTTAKPGEAGVTIALLHPTYPATTLCARIAPSFAENMHADLQEVLTARGFTVKGPFRTYDEMVYSEKQGSDVILTPTLEVECVVPSDALRVKTEYKLRLVGTSGNVYKIDTATVTLSGRVTLHVAESMTKEKLWAPSVSLPSRSTGFRGEFEYSEPPSEREVHREPVLRQIVSKGLEEVYAIIMKECWDRLDPAELRVQKKQADEIKKKAGYIVGNR